MKFYVLYFLILGNVEKCYFEYSFARIKGEWLVESYLAHNYR